MRTITIEGPLGPFHVPDEDPRTREGCIALSREVWGRDIAPGEYDHPELPTDGVYVVLDIGAGWGAFAVWAAKRWPGVAILAYEPHEEAAQLCLRNTINMNCVVFGSAVTTDKGAVLNGCEDWGAWRTHNEKSGRIVPTIHPAALPPCDVIKIDCEGCEAEVLGHYGHWERVRAVLWEFHTPDLRKECRDILLARGFRPLAETPEERGYGPNVWVRA